MKKLVIVLLFIGFIGYVGNLAHTKLSTTVETRKRGGNRAVPVAVTAVSKQTIRDLGEFTGTLLPKARFIVAPKVSGRLERLFVNMGDKVKNGDTIAILDSEEYVQQVAEAEAQLEVSMAGLAECASTLEVVKRDFHRSEAMKKQNVATDAEFEAARGKYRSAEAKHQVAMAQIRQRKAALKAVEIRASYTKILADWKTGELPRVISERFVDEGAMLKATEPIVSIVDISSVVAVINVIERDYPRIRIGQTAVVATDAYRGRKFTGKVVRKAPVLDEQSRQGRIELEIPNDEGLLAPGMFLRVEMEFEVKNDATVVPVDGLVKRNGVDGIFLVDEGSTKARFVPVTLGIVYGPIAEVLKPPLEGMVVTLGRHLLEDGSTVVFDTETAPKPVSDNKEKAGSL